MTNLTTIEQLDSNNPSLSPASANWGKVYQNYISINLSSDQLMKGAYDAYNLLTAGKLSDFQGKAITAINTLITNQNTLASDLRTTETNLNATINTTNSKLDTTSSQLSKIAENLDELFSSYKNDELVSILEGTICCSKNKLSFPSNDNGTATSYDLSSNVTIPFVSSSTPGLLKGSDYTQFSKVRNLFDTVSTSASSKYTLSFPSNDNGTKTSYDLSDSVSIDFVTASNPGLLKGSDYNKFSKVSDKFTSSVSSWKADSANDLAANASSMDILVFKINRLQAQVNELLSVINGLFSDSSSYVVGKLNVKSITFTSADVSKISLDNFGNTNYIKPDIVKLPN